MVEINKTVLGVVLVVLAIFGGTTIKWQFDKDYISLYSDDNLIAKERWVVEAERTSFSLEDCTYKTHDNGTKERICKSNWYAKNVKCPKVIDLGGHVSSSGKSCMYPDNYYEQLSRSLINTEIDSIGDSVTKTTPNYKYGTRGAYAGKVIETMLFDENIVSEQDFPKDYTVSWNPTDTRNYKLIWRVESLKDFSKTSLGDKWLYGMIGTDIPCQYEFGNVKIDFMEECDKLEKVELNKESGKAYFYFKPQRDIQIFNIKFVDPLLSEEELDDNTKIIDKYVVKELCTPDYKTWTEEIEHFKTCIIYYNATISSKEPPKEEGYTINKSDGEYIVSTLTSYNYSCLDYVEYIEHINEQVDCIKTGKIQVGETIYGDADNFAVLKGNKVCLQSEIDGGQYAIDWRDDDSVDIGCQNILTGEISVKGNKGFKKKTTETLNVLKTKVELDAVSIK